MCEGKEGGFLNGIRTPYMVGTGTQREGVGEFISVMTDS